MTIRKKGRIAFTPTWHQRRSTTLTDKQASERTTKWRCQTTRWPPRTTRRRQDQTHSLASTQRLSDTLSAARLTQCACQVPTTPSESEERGMISCVPSSAGVEEPTPQRTSSSTTRRWRTTNTSTRLTQLPTARVGASSPNQRTNEITNAMCQPV